MANGKFEFDGEGLSFLWLMIWTSILTVLTLSFFSPWAYVIRQKWIAEHTTINGKRLTFRGTGGGLLGTWFVVMLLCLITFGIYLPWGFCRIKRWQISNLYFADEGDVEKG